LSHAATVSIHPSLLGSLDILATEPVQLTLIHDMCIALWKKTSDFSLAEPATEKSICAEICAHCAYIFTYLHYSSLMIHGGAMMIGPDRQWRFVKWRVTFVYLKSTNSRCPKNVLEPIDDQFHLMTLVRPWRSTPAKKKRPRALAWHWESPQGWRKGECSIAEN
jgi:hypothetical protein